MVDECQYFIGILGYRYGWRPDKKMDGSPNQERWSITEMEIRHAIEKQEREGKRRRFFLFGDISQYNKEDVEKESQEDRLSLEELKAYLRSRGEEVYDFQNQEDLLSLIHQNLQKMLDQDYPPGEKVDLIEYSRMDALREILEEKRKGFVGRAEYL
ncbi:MAG: DUF4062 domain-containing protein, partial [Planctomycetota bacterium]